MVVLGRSLGGWEVRGSVSISFTGKWRMGRSVDLFAGLIAVDSI